MARLSFVGLGLWDAHDMTLRAREVLARAEHVVAEFYTSRLFGAENIDLAKVMGRSFEILPREAVEAMEPILGRCTGDDAVALVTAGDALTATTHQALRIEAVRRGIDVEIIHGVSIKTAASALLGLSDYKFGRTTTLVFPEPNYVPESPLDVIAENRERGLHTLVLLDIRSHEGRYMSAAEGCENILMLLERRAQRDEAVAAATLGPDTPVCAVARAGAPEPGLHAGPLTSFVDRDLGGPLHCLVVPGRLSEEEVEVVAAVTGYGFPSEP